MADRIKKYLKNLDKETTQAGNAGETLRVLKGTPKGKAAANKLRNERGQMFGALLQGRRYDENGKQITKSSSKPVVNKTTAKPKPKPTSKATPTPKFTPPSLQDFKKSAAYKTNALTYKEYVAIAQDSYKAKLKRQQGR